MSKRILVPIEGSARDTEALSVARHLARQMSAAIVMVHVAPEFFDTRDVVAAEQRLDEYAQGLRAEDIEAHFLMEYGEPATGIARVARQQDAAMIVLAPEQRAVLEVLWRPHVSSGLLGRSSTPLFILPDVPAGSGAPELLAGPDAKVILAVDGSMNAEAALPLAIQLAQSYQRPLLLVRVVPPVFILGAGVDTLKAQHDTQYAEEAEAHRYLVEVRQRIAAETQLTVETSELVGPIAEHLTHLAAAHRGSVLVLGTHGRGGLARVVIGSVAAEVMDRATTPVIIVPSHPARGAQGR